MPHTQWDEAILLHTAFSNHNFFTYFFILIAKELYFQKIQISRTYKIQQRQNKSLKNLIALCFFPNNRLNLI